MSRHKLLLPDLGIDDQPITVSSWLVKRGAHIDEHDPVVEILCGGITIDLPAGVSGTLVEKSASEDDEIQPGQTLAIIEIPDD
jgi:pyruvate/2-oxoglutarate dehydrogenase complex dihydrolipoamide acyltransferase (E2) component